MHTPAEPGAAFPLGLVRPQGPGCCVPKRGGGSVPWARTARAICGCSAAPWDVQEAGHGAPPCLQEPSGVPPKHLGSECPHPCRAPSGPRESPWVRSWGRRGQELQGQVGCVSPRSLPRLGLGRPRLQAVTCLAVITGDFRGFAFLPGPRLGNNFHHQAVPEKAFHLHGPAQVVPRELCGHRGRGGSAGPVLGSSWAL